MEVVETNAVRKQAVKDVMEERQMVRLDQGLHTITVELYLEVVL